jgi:mannosyltransferase OCH1-like enzyme
MPEAFVAFGETWRTHHPHWQMLLWDESNLPRLANQELFDQAGEIAPGFEGQLRSDIARLEMLYEHGGVYLDTDFECLRPIDPLLEGVRCFAAWEIQNKVVNNAVLGCEPEHPFIGHLIEELPRSISESPGRRPSKMSGPHFVTAMWRQHGRGVTVFPEKWFYPYGCKELHRAGEDFPDAYAVHHWANQRRLRRKPL